MTVVIFLLVFLLRLPSFFEPYWYGDEGIYLAIAQAIQRGAVLYRDIWDNKTPLLYLIYSLIPTLLWAKITATVCVLGTVYFVKKITKSSLAALTTGVLMSLPTLEGTIANAELYFTLPIVIAAYVVIARERNDRGNLSKDCFANARNDITIGICLALAFLIKVPAVFDFIGLFLAYFVITRKIKPFFVMAVPVVLSFSIFLLYFYFQGALSDFFIASFSQNASYVAIDSGPFSKLSNPLIVRAIILFAVSLLTVFVYLKKLISKELFTVVLWFGFSLYGALLSNRPYLHYLLQIIPPAVILGYLLLKNIKKYYLVFFVFCLVIFNLYSSFKDAFRLPTKYYYQNFYDYVTGQKSWVDFANWFDGRTVTNYKIANQISGNNLFVWGDNAFIYVLSQIPPTTKFIQAHHLTTINPKNYGLIIEQIKIKKPEFIVVVRPVRFPFPGLEEQLDKNYQLVRIIGENHLYQISRDVSDKTTN